MEPCNCHSEAQERHVRDELIFWLTVGAYLATIITAIVIIIKNSK